jgi:hypothetical protein
MMTVSLEGVHDPLLIVQTKLFAPTLSPVTPDEGDDGVVTVPPPERTLQAPVPTVGVLPANVLLVVQID